MKLKQKPSDFIVTELTSIKPESAGPYTYFILKKTNYTTIDALSRIAQALHIQSKSITFAGSKDKAAVTTQLCSVPRISKDRMEKLSLKDIEITFFGYGSKPISLGDLMGNQFRIVVRDLEKRDITPPTEVINYFDEQRFSASNLQVGRAIIKKDFKTAAQVIAQAQGDYNIAVKNYLEKNKTDYVGALRTIQKKILTMFVNSYQSWMFNEMAAAYMKENINQSEIKSVPYSNGAFLFTKQAIQNIKIPLMGFATVLNPEIKTIAQDLLKKENITPRDFIVREIPDLSSEGDIRSLVIEVKDFTAAFEDDDLNVGKKKAILEFSLPKGSYATIVIKSISAEI